MSSCAILRFSCTYLKYRTQHDFVSSGFQLAVQVLQGGSAVQVLPDRRLQICGNDDCQIHKKTITH